MRSKESRDLELAKEIWRQREGPFLRKRKQGRIMGALWKGSAKGKDFEKTGAGN